MKSTTLTLILSVFSAITSAFGQNPTIPTPAPFTFKNLAIGTTLKVTYGEGVETTITLSTYRSETAAAWGYSEAENLGLILQPTTQPTLGYNFLCDSLPTENKVGNLYALLYQRWGDCYEQLPVKKIEVQSGFVSEKPFILDFSSGDTLRMHLATAERPIDFIASSEADQLLTNGSFSLQIKKANFEWQRQCGIQGSATIPAFAYGGFYFLCTIADGPCVAEMDITGVEVRPAAEK